MAAKLTPMQLRAATQRRNSYITAGVAFGLVGGVYYYTMQAMSGRSLDDVDIEKYRSMSSSGDVTPGAQAAANYDQWAKKEGEALGPLSSGPSIAPGGNPMLEKQ